MQALGRRLRPEHRPFTHFVLEELEPRVLLSGALAPLPMPAQAGAVIETVAITPTIQWNTDASGFWDDASNWLDTKTNLSRIPDTTDDVLIDRGAANPTVTIRTAGVAANLLDSENLVVTGGGTLSMNGVLSSTGQVKLSGGTLSGGTIEAGTTVTLTQGSGGASNALDGITLDGTILTQASGSVTNGLKLDPGSLIRLGGRPGGIPFTGSLTLIGDQAIAGTGEIRFSDVSSTLSIAGAVTIAPGITIDGLTGQVSISSIGGSLTNEGTIEPSVGGTLSVSSGSWTNAPSGVLRADGGSLTLGGTWSNQGEIAVGAKAGSALNLGGTFTTAGIGKLTRDGTLGNSIAIVGRMNNTDDTLALNTDTGPWILTGHGILTGGTIATSADAPLVAQRDGSNASGELAGVSLDGTLVSKSVIITHGLTLAPGSMVLADGGVTFSSGDQTVGGTGTIRFNPGGLVLNGGTVTIGAGITIDGTSGSVTGGGGSQLINQGTISLSAGSDLNMTASSWVNAASGLLIGDGSKLHLKGNWSNAGTIIVGPGTGSVLELGGTVKAAELGTIIRNDPTNTTVNVTGTIDIAGGTLALNAASGNWLMQGGTISGGTLMTRDGVRVLSPITGSGRLNAITLDGTVSTESSSALFVTGGLTMMPGSLFEIGGSQTGTLINGQITLLGDQTIGGTGELRLSAQKSVSEIIIQSGNATFAPGITVDGNNGAIVAQSFGTGAKLTNEGTIGADAGGTLSVSVPFTNAASGVLRADGGRLDLSGSWSNAGEILVGAAAGSVLRLGGTFTTAGLGHYTRAGGRIDLSGTLDNSNNTLSLNADTGSWNLIGFGRLSGGTLSTKDGAQLVTAVDPGISNSVALNNLTVAGTIAVSNGAALTMTGGLTFDNGLMLVGEPPTGTTHHDSSVTFVGSQTIGGTGEIRLFGPRSGPNIESALRFNLASGEAQGSVTIGPNVTLAGDTVDLVAASKMTLTNQGTIAPGPGGSFITTSGPSGGYSFINQGSMIYANAGVSIDGQFRLDAGSALRDPGGEITFTGTLDNTDKTLTLDDNLGIFNLADNGTIKGGTIVTVGTNDLVVFHTTGILDGVTLKGGVDLSFARTNSIGVKILNGLTMDGGLIKMGVGAYLIAEGSQTLGGKGSVLFTDKNASNVIAPTAGSKLTIGPDITIHGTVGKVDATGGLIDNQGTIAADGGGTITAITASQVAGGTLTGGTWQALGTGTLRLSGAKIATNAANLLLDGAGAKIIDDNSSTATLAGLTANASGGAITVLNGAQIAPAGNFSNAGSLGIGADTSFAQASTSQFASSVIAFSSQFTASNYSAAQVLGASNVTAYGDSTRAWAPLSKNGTTEFVTVGFATPVFADGATVRETLGNGFVTEIDVLDTSDVLHTVWTGTDPSVAGSATDFKVTWERTPYLVKGIKVLIDTNHSANTWEEIDSIQLQGLTSLGSYQQTAGVTMLEGGTLAFAGGVNLQGGVLGGAGTVATDLTNAALVDPGSPTGILNFAKSYTQTADGHLKLDVGGTTVGTEYDRLNVAGTAELAGTLDIALINGFAATTGQVFDVMTYARATGTFGAVNGAAPMFTTDQTATSLRLHGITVSPDLSLDGMTIPAAGVAGEDVVIEYMVTNNGVDTAVGGWHDSVYISAKATLDATALLLGRVQHTGSVAVGDSYTGKLTAALPNLSPGDYHVIVLADSQGVVPDIDRANNAGASGETVAVTVPALTIGAPVTGSIKDGQDIYYRLLASPGDELTITAAFDNAPAGELYLRFGRLPDRVTFDASDTSLTSRQPHVVLSNAQGGEYYILLHGRGSSQSFTLSAQTAPFQLDGFKPGRVMNQGITSLALTGTRFSPDTTVSLLAGTGTVYAATSTFFVDSTHLSATFDFTGMPLGTYAVRAHDGASTATASTSLVVTDELAGGEPSIRMIVPAYGRVGTPFGMTIEIDNSSGGLVPLPLVVVDASNVADKKHQQFVDPTLPLFMTPGTQVGFGEFYQPSPKASGIVSSMTLSLLDLDQKIDWDAKKASMRPDGYSVEAWDAVWANLRPRLGDTLGELYTLLFLDASNLAQNGVRTTSLKQLLAYEVRQANDEAPSRPVIAAVDLAFPAPGLPLVLERTMASTVTGRYDTGRFGHGWVDNFNIYVSTDSARQVTVHQAGAARVFNIMPDGTFIGAAGETATLSKLGGAFQLREKDGALTTFRADGALDYIADTNGNRITASYDAASRLTNLIHSNGTALTFTYDSSGRVVQAIDPAGRTAQYAYDASGHLVSVTTPQGVTTYGYTPDTSGPAAHGIASITNPSGTHLFLQYDSQGRLQKKQLDNGAEAVNFTYGTASFSAIDAQDRVTQFFYDDRGRIARIKDAQGRLQMFRHDQAGNLLSVGVPENGARTYAFDAARNVTATTDTLGASQSFAYTDSLNRLAAWTDANSNRTSFQIDAAGNVVGITFADGSGTQRSYDADGLLVQSVSRNGHIAQFTYDNRGLVLTRTVDGTTTTTYAYDDRANLLSATDAGGTISMQYDSADRLIGIAYPDGRSLSFSYDAGGRRTQSVDQDGFAVNYQYDEAGRMTGLTTGSGDPIVHYSYDSAGRVIREDNGNNTYTINQYDEAGQLLQVTHYAPDSSVNSQFQYTYDGLGRRASMTTFDGTTTYGYDGGGRLISVQLPGGRTLNYAYDAAGNRTSVNDDGAVTAYLANNLNQYVSIGGNPSTYDLAGNLVGVGGATMYAYDALNRLVGATDATGSWAFEYDALGNRIAATHNGQRTEYLLDPLGAGSVVGEYDGTGQLIAHYTQGLGLTSRVDGTNAATYYDFDGIGSTVGLSGASGSYVNQYSYLPFGEPLAAVEGVANPFRFDGAFGVQSDATGLTYMRARYYDPAQARFTQPDPIGLAGGSNLYAFALNDPVGYADATGLAPGISGAPVTGSLAGNVGGFVAFGIGVGYSYSFDLSGNGSSQYQVGLGFGVGVGAGIQHGDDLHGTSFDVSAGGGPASVALGVDQHGNFYKGVNFGPGTDIGFLIGPSFNGEVMSSEEYDLAIKEGQYLRDLQDAGVSGIADTYDPLADFQDLQSHERSHATHTQVGPVDPNELFGPGGFGAQQFIQPHGMFPYSVYFANDPKALAPAQNVVVTEQLDANLDWSTFQLGDLGWGDIIVDVPEGRQVYSTRVDARDTLGLFVDVTAGLDTTTGVVTWTFTSLDPATLDAPADPFAGFLPPDTDGHIGQGFATYFISPKSDLPTGTVIGAEASIVFDTEAAMSTPPWNNTMDAAGPSSSIVALPAVTTTTGIDLDWSGTDDASGSGIASYDVLISDNGAAYTTFLTATTLTSATFTGQSGHTYSFYTIATDNVGHVEAAPAAADATTRVQLIGDVLSSDTAPGVVKDADGTTLDVVLTGPGHWQVVQGTTGPQFQVTGTTSDSAIALKTSGGDGRFLLTGVDIAGPAQSLIGTAIDLNGPFALHGPIASLFFGDIAAAGGATIGAGARFDATRFISGVNAPMNLTIQGGGRMITAPLPAATGAAASVGDTLDASGSYVTVTGTNSLWQVNGQLVVGNASHGSLSITDGAAVVAASVDAASAASGNGVISVVGADSRLSTTDGLVLGSASAADLWVLNGAVVTAANAVLGLLAGSSGVLDIEGAGSRVDITGDLTIGGSGTAVLVLGAGTELNVGGNLIIGPGGVLDSFGGTIGSPTVSLPALSVTLANDTGTSASDNITADPTTSGKATATNGIATLRAGLGAAPDSSYLDLTDAISVEGSFSVSPAQLAALNGAALPPGDYTMNFVLTDKAGRIKRSNLAFTLLMPDQTSVPFGQISSSIAEPVGTVGPVSREMSVGPARYVADLPLPAHVSLDPGDWTMDIGQFDPFDWFSGKFRGHRPLGAAWTLSLGRGIGLLARLP